MFEKYSNLARKLGVSVSEIKNGKEIFREEFFYIVDDEFFGFLLSMEGKNIQDSTIIFKINVRFSSDIKENERIFVLQDREIFYTSDIFNNLIPLLNTYEKED